ncbi:uncharacterized protein [Clytia hemisphaerica]|uniref:uncharacterized protein isoform X2 n=1 Tax=Clytia hemisphaerica TaxID=252671 RepID=UPI0034D605BB
MITELNSSKVFYYEKRLLKSGDLKTCRIMQYSIDMSDMKYFDPLHSSYNESLIDGGHDEFGQKIRQFSKTIMACKSCGTQDNGNQQRRRTFHYTKQPYQEDYPSTQHDQHEVDYLKHEMEELRRDNNRMFLETTYLRKENNLYLKRLREEHILRERLMHQLDEQRHHQQNTQNSYQDIDSLNSKTLDSDLMREQLKAYRDDFNEEKRIRERYCRRNVELEHELEEAKRTMEIQQKKLICYAQIVSHPLHKLDVPLIYPSSGVNNKSHSASSSPPYPPCPQNNNNGRMPRIARIETKKYPASSSDHIIEATLMSGDLPTRIKRASSIDSCKDGLTNPSLSSTTNTKTQNSFTWSLHSSDDAPPKYS